ncbi:MAG: zinc ribbon domain-containing protein [Magnetococcus sp. MYC-9]
MALYDYKCDGCGVGFEVDHPMSAPPVRVCPECGAQRVRKVLSTGGIGSGGSRQSAAPPPSCATGGCGSGMCSLGR